jgi:hypothetical protein
MLVIRAQLDSTIVTTTDLGLPRIADSSVLLAAPRGYCAGVDRAVVTVEKALDLYGAPVYVRKQIVHNKHVVANLESRGAASVKLAALLDKHERRQREVKIDYLGFPIPDEFVVGYGLDFAERYRNLPFIAVLKNPEA